MKRILLKPGVVAVVVGMFTVAWSFSGGPPDGRTGGPGESNCTVSCHSSFPLNSGNGIFALSGPGEYQPGGPAITISVSLSQVGQSRWGFEATVLDANDEAVGNIVVTDLTNTQPGGPGARQYVKHTTTGTFNGENDASPGWSFDWEPPAADAGPVTFYAAGNAANGNFNNQGDFIYTKSLTITPAQVQDCCGQFTAGETGNFNYDQDGVRDLSDILAMASYAFLGGQPGPCLAEGNVDGDANCVIDLTDILRLASYSFLGGDAPALCDPQWPCQT